MAKVIYINNLDVLEKYQQAPFLQLGAWYTDRMRAIPVNSYERGTFFNADKIHLKSMFLLPMFSNEQAYRGIAKAWLAFEYQETISKSEFEEMQGKAQFNEFLRHFKKINVRAFSYFKSYPENKNKEVYIYLAKTHSYFQSGYINIYEGQDIDRDLLAQYQARLFVYYFIFIVLPIIMVSSCFLRLKTCD